jgi:hypothetical protein
MNLKIEKEKVIAIKSSLSEVLDFKYNKNLTLGVDQYYNYECEIIKLDDTIEVDNLVMRFLIGDDQNNNTSNTGGISKSMINLGSSIFHYNKIGNKRIKSQTEISIEEINFKAEESLILGSKDNYFKNVDHEFIIKNDDGSVSSYTNCLVLKLNRIETNSPVKCNFLIKFCDPGQYQIKFEASYKILKKEIYDDTSVLNHSGGIKFEVKVPFTLKHE